MQFTWMMTKIGIVALVGGMCLMNYEVGVTLAAKPDNTSTQTDLKSWSAVIPVSVRFVVLSSFSNQAVLDQETGLVWEKSPSAITDSWGNQRTSCTNRSFGGHLGWRLPSVVELLSLVDPTQSSPSLPLGHPFTSVQVSSYWTATISATSNTTDAWLLNLANGSVGESNMNTIIYAWCVRGPMNADTY